MNKIFTKVRQGNIINRQLTNFLTILELTQFILAIDLIFPINNDYNYYFPIYFLSHFLYMESGKITNYTLTENNPNYINSTLRSTKENNNILYYITNKYIKTLPKDQKYFCFFDKTFTYLTFGIFILILSGIAFLLFMDDKNKNNSTIKKKLVILVNFILIKLNFVCLKPLFSFFILIISNYAIPTLFFSISGNLGLLNILNIFILISFVLLSIFFIEYMWIAYSERISDQYSFGTYEKIKLINKILICFMIQYDYFDTLHSSFTKFLCFSLIIYQCFIYLKIFSQGVKNTIIDFFFHKLYNMPYFREINTSSRRLFLSFNLSK